MRSTAWLSICLALAAAACGGEAQSGDAGTSDVATNGTRHLPLATGVSWTYLVTDPMTGQTEQKTSTVGPLEDVGGSKAGVMAYRVTTQHLDSSTVSWQEDTGEKIVRHKEQTFDLAGTMTREEFYVPFKLRLDETSEHLQVGATWTDMYMEAVTGNPVPVQKTEDWTVEAIDEEVTVDAGTFRCLRVRRRGAAGVGADKTYWFARGVGKIREVGGQTEELVTYSFP